MNNLLNIILFCITILTLVLISCSKSEEVSGDQEEKNLIINTVWEHEGSNCNSYFLFKKDTFVFLNPCYSENNIIKLVSWNKGVYQTNLDSITLTTTSSCDISLIGNKSHWSYSIDNTILTLFINGGYSKYNKVSSLPEITNDVSLGYWDSENGGVWVDVEDCIIEY